MTLRLGILGTGNIASQFARDLDGSERCEAVAVGSRSQASADAFADRFEIPHRHGSYDALLADDSVQAVYVSLPNSMHHDWTLRALAAGKHVLCEKPLAVTAEQAGEMFDAADRAGRLLVEAFMYRSHPQTAKALELVRSGAIGRLKLIRTSFCYRTQKTAAAENVRFDAALAGGAMRDIGCYCVDLARLLTQADPQAVACDAVMHAAGVDEYAAGSLRFEGGVLASFACGMTLQADNAACLCGEEGYIRIPVPWKPPVSQALIEVHTMTPPRQDGKAGGGPQETAIRLDAPASLYALEADAFAAAVLDGAAPAVSREDSMSNARTMDALLHDAGIG